jgi:hypothetical protein
MKRNYLIIFSINTFVRFWEIRDLVIKSQKKAYQELNYSISNEDNKFITEALNVSESLHHLILIFISSKLKKSLILLIFFLDF